MPSGCQDTISDLRRGGLEVWRRAVLSIVAVFALFVLAGPAAARAAKAAKEPAPTAAELRRKAFAAVKSWGIHLRYMDKRQIAASPFDLVVVDYAPYRHLTFEFPYERADVAEMQKKPDGSRRLVLAYLSIGEAEDYRYYWRRREWADPAARPAWVGPENPKWPGNYPARFWLPEWQSVLLGQPSSYLDRIVAAGFDGVYLDRADAYEEWTQENPRAEADMTTLIGRISAHARRANPEFLIVLQNAEQLLAKRPVRTAIDGFAKEDLVFGAEAEEQANARTMVDYSLGLLRQGRRSGLPILVLEYLADPAKAAEARRRITAEGFLPHFAERTLNRLTMVGPDEAAAPAARP